MYRKQGFFDKMISLQEFSVEIFEWSGSSWLPYVAKDVQVQFYLMSPYILKTLSTNQKVHFFKIMELFSKTPGSSFHVSAFAIGALSHFI